MDRQRIGFVSTRFAGTDGVSLESAKWAKVLWDHRHTSYWYAGKLDRDPGSAVHMVKPVDRNLDPREPTQKTREGRVTVQPHSSLWVNWSQIDAISDDLQPVAQAKLISA